MKAQQGGNLKPTAFREPHHFSGGQQINSTAQRNFLPPKVGTAQRSHGLPSSDDISFLGPAMSGLQRRSEGKKPSWENGEGLIPGLKATRQSLLASGSPQHSQRGHKKDRKTLARQRKPRNHGQRKAAAPEKCTAPSPPTSQLIHGPARRPTVS